MNTEVLDASLARRFDYRRRVESADLQPWELALCADDLVHWVSHWLLTYDPREPVTAIPFDPFPKQVEFLHWLEERERL